LDSVTLEVVLEVETYTQAAEAEALAELEELAQEQLLVLVAQDGFVH
jgi:hypothetical protein